MNSRLAVLLLTTAVGSVPQTVFAQGHTQRGAILGGVSGAMIGAGIGNHNDETAAGALIGGAVGLITGSAIGNSLDESDRRYIARQRYQEQVRVSQAVSINDAISMTRSGLSSDVIVNQIQQNGVTRRLSSQDVITLHRNGVPSDVISAMQRASGPNAGVYERPIRRPSPPVVVHEYRYVPRPPVYYHAPVYRGYGRHPHYHGSKFHRSHRNRVSWGVSIHN